MLTSDTTGFPLTTADAVGGLAVSAPSSTSWEQQVLENLSQAKIFVVETESICREVESVLAKAGYEEIRTFSDAATALTSICDEVPDVMLLDQRLAVENSELLAAMQADASVGQIPIILLTTLDESVQRVAALGASTLDVLLKPLQADALLARVRNQLLIKGYRDQLTRYAERLEREVYIDELTKTGNRRAFEKEVQQRLRQWNTEKTPLAFLLIDIDHFKKVNDCYGHRAGDKLLRNLSRVIQDQLGSDAVLCRYGGEELAVLLSGTTADEAKQMAERIRQSVEQQTFVFEELQLKMTVSIGITIAIQRDNSAIFFQRADSALYASKQHGRNCCHFNDGNLSALTGDAPRDVENEEELAATEFNRPTAGELTHSKIMIVDDEPVMILTVKKHLKDGGFLQFVTCDQSEQALAMIREEQPDVVLLDICMPKVSGLEILAAVRAEESIQHIPMVVLTSSTDENTKSEALQLGAFDFLAKPVNVSELLSRVRNTLMVKAQHDRLAHYSQQLEFEINRRTSELFASRSEVIHCLASAAECRDDQTGFHIVRVGRYATIIASELEFEEDQIPSLESAAQLHDVGKIGISDTILRKHGTLTDEERETMKCHSEIGVKILKQCNSPVMRMAAVVAETHHEKWDGSGYPRGLKGDEIPLVGRITAVADVFDALSNKRYYKDAFDLEECFQLIEESKGTHFDPEVVDAFLRRKKEVIQVYHDYADSIAEGLPTE